MNPYFSIVIPTKNRPTFLKDSVRSVLLQDFDDYELIISDNFNDQSTLQAVEPFLDDKRVRYFRTDRELNMPDHWEFATRKAIGKYVILLADRKVLYKGALGTIFTILKKHNERFNVCSFRVKMYDNENERMGWSAKSAGTKVFKSTELIYNFLNENYLSSKSYDQYFPKTLNGCYKNSFASAIREKTGSYFNIPGVTTPDFSSCFINLLSEEEILYIGRPIILTQGEATSNGRLFTSGKYREYFDALGLSDDEIYRFVPVRAPFVCSWIMNDYLFIRNVLKKENKSPGINLNAYFALLHIEFRYKTAGKEMYEKELNDALQKQSASAREEISKLADRWKQAMLQKEKNPFNHLRDFINHRFSYIGLVNRIMKYRFSDVLTAAGFNNSEIKKLS